MKDLSFPTRDSIRSSISQRRIQVFIIPKFVDKESSFSYQNPSNRSVINPTDRLDEIVQSNRSVIIQPTGQTQMFHPTDRSCPVTDRLASSYKFCKLHSTRFQAILSGILGPSIHLGGQVAALMILGLRSSINRGFVISFQHTTNTPSSTIN